MVKITSNGIEVIKGDIFNLLTVPETWDSTAVYTCTVTARGVSKNIECSLFRDKYVRLYSEDLNLKVGTYNFKLYKGSQLIMENYLIVKGVSHNV